MARLTAYSDSIDYHPSQSSSNTLPREIPGMTGTKPGVRDPLATESSLIDFIHRWRRRLLRLMIKYLRLSDNSVRDQIVLFPRCGWPSVADSTSAAGSSTSTRPETGKSSEVNECVRTLAVSRRLQPCPSSRHRCRHQTQLEIFQDKSLVVRYGRYDVCYAVATMMFCLIVIVMPIIRLDYQLLMLSLQADIDGIVKPNSDPSKIKPELKQVAERELHETPHVLAENIKKLRALLVGDESLHARTDDIFLSAFLRARKHNVEKAFICVKQYYEFKSKYADYYSYCLPSECSDVYDTCHFRSVKQYYEFKSKYADYYSYCLPSKFSDEYDTCHFTSVIPIFKSKYADYYGYCLPSGVAMCTTLCHFICIQLCDRCSDVYDTCHFTSVFNCVTGEAVLRVQEQVCGLSTATACCLKVKRYYEFKSKYADYYSYCLPSECSDVYDTCHFRSVKQYYEFKSKYADCYSYCLPSECSDVYDTCHFTSVKQYYEFKSKYADCYSYCLPSECSDVYDTCHFTSVKQYYEFKSKYADCYSYCLPSECSDVYDTCHFTSVKQYYEFKSKYADYYSYCLPSECSDVYDTCHFRSVKQYYEFKSKYADYYSYCLPSECSDVYDTCHFRSVKQYYEFKSKYADYYSYCLPSECSDVYDTCHFRSVIPIVVTGEAVLRVQEQVTDLITQSLAQYTRKERAIIDAVKVKFGLILLAFYICWLPNLINSLFLWFEWFNLPAQTVYVLLYIMVTYHLTLSIKNDLTLNNCQHNWLNTRHLFQTDIQPPHHSVLAHGTWPPDTGALTRTPSQHCQR
ncbi:hypothetical protein J6590_100730 [Homalodisca vitripennis]|nr:hypothetical protein J6590_100730 [Homalodisca vitripennis]